jgi:hypothetical protein
MDNYNVGLRANWMKYVQNPETTKLSALTIPGTHDTGTFSCEPGSSPRCQEMPLAMQFGAGIRFIDIRLAPATNNRGNSDLTISHNGPVPGPLYFSSNVMESGRLTRSCRCLQRSLAYFSSPWIQRCISHQARGRFFATTQKRMTWVETNDLDSSRRDLICELMIQQLRNRFRYVPYTIRCRNVHLQKPLKQ